MVRISPCITALSIAVFGHCFGLENSMAGITSTTAYTRASVRYDFPGDEDPADQNNSQEDTAARVPKTFNFTDDGSSAYAKSSNQARGTAGFLNGNARFKARQIPDGSTGYSSVAQAIARTQINVDEQDQLEVVVQFGRSGTGYVSGGFVGNPRTISTGLPGGSLTMPIRDPSFLLEAHASYDRTKRPEVTSGSAFFTAKIYRVSDTERHFRGEIRDDPIRPDMIDASSYAFSLNDAYSSDVLDAGANYVSPSYEGFGLGEDRLYFSELSVVAAQTSVSAPLPPFSGYFFGVGEGGVRFESFSLPESGMGVLDAFRVLVPETGNSLTFGEGEIVDFNTVLPGGVAGFSILPLHDNTRLGSTFPRDFQLSFAEAGIADFTVAAIANAVPEPHSLLLLTWLATAYRRRMQTQSVDGSEVDVRF